MGGVAIQHPHYYTIYLLNNLRQLVTMPPWQTVYDHFSKWNKLGVWERIVDRLNQIVRLKKNRKPFQVTGLSMLKALKHNTQAKSVKLMGAKK